MIIFYLYFPFLQPQYWPYLLTTAFVLAVLAHGWRLPWLFAGLGGFLLGQMIGKVALVGWDPAALFGLSAALGVALAGLAFVAERPVVVLSSFAGVGFLAYTMGEILGVGSPWNLVVYAVAGAIAVAALFLRPFHQGLVFILALSCAGAIIATLIAWIHYVRDWNQGWSAVIIGAIVAIVGIIHQLRELPEVAAAPSGVGAPRHAG